MSGQQQESSEAKGLQGLLGTKPLKGKDGLMVEVDELAQYDLIGIYFSAHWCPPCRGFTPRLVERYEKLKTDGKRFEIVFVSSDRDDPSFEEYFKEMPWLALPYADRDQKEKLAQMYGVRGIPTLVLVDSSGKLVTKEGRSEVMSDSLPWKSEPV